MDSQPGVPARHTTHMHRHTYTHLKLKMHSNGNPQIGERGRKMNKNNDLGV